MGANAWRSAQSRLAGPARHRRRHGPDDDRRNRLNTTNPEAFDELDRLIRSSRNHPSIILWSVGNEEGHQAAASAGGTFRPGS
jgi:beta-galactosidase